MRNHGNRRTALVRMSRALGRNDLHLAILGEGNTSTRLGAGRILVKVSGTSLGSLAAKDLVECRSETILALLDVRHHSDESLDRALRASCVRWTGKKPSIEVLFHAWLLTLPGIEFVGHAHPVAANQILCSPRARAFATRRVFPDEVVCCGPESVFVPYADPGHPLAREIRKRTEAFMKRYGASPRVILLENHGVITIGRTPDAVMAAMLMADKAAQIWIGTAHLGGPTFMSARDIRRITVRSDEHFRKRVLNI